MINNDRYETIIEDVLLTRDRFVCMYVPVYGLVRIENSIYKIDNKTGIGFTRRDEPYIKIIYVREKAYIDYHIKSKELNEEEICDILRKLN